MSSFYQFLGTIISLPVEQVHSDTCVNEVVGRFMGELLFVTAQPVVKHARGRAQLLLLDLVEYDRPRRRKTNTNYLQ